MATTSNAAEAYKALALIARAVGDIKSVAKRISPEGENWPEEIRQFLKYLRELQDELDQSFPANIK